MSGAAARRLRTLHCKMHLDLASLLLVAAALSLHSVAAYSNGKVTESCKSMKPGHGHASSRKPSPYSITVDKEKFNPGDRITVTLSGSSSGGKSFKGFLIEARDASHPNDHAIGSFTLLNPHDSQLLNCGTSEGSAVSHTHKSGKLEMQVVWNAPSDSPPAVQFLATVVEHYDTYWVKIPSPVITQNNVSPPPILPTTTNGQTVPSTHLTEPFSAEGCGRIKSCLRDPVGCDPQTDPKCYFLSFAKKDVSVVFELSGPAEGYASFALSYDKWMGNDDVYLCVRSRDNVVINSAYVLGRTHPEVSSESSLMDTAWRLSDGVIQCKFRRNIHIPTENCRFNLDESYYIFLASGKAENGLIHRHHQQPLISSGKKTISGPPEDLIGSRSPLIIKTHGTLMLIAWITTVSIGVIIARFYKPMWPGSTLFGEKIWFQVHRILMASTVLLTCIAFILPFAYRGGWSKKAGAHPFLGCTVLALTILQPLMAILRPHPDSLRRYIFNWMHWGTGTVARIIAVAAMFLGAHQQALVLPSPSSTLVLSGFVVWDVAAHLLLELHNYHLFRKGKNATDDEQEILNSYVHVPEGNLFKKVVLTIYICGNAGFLIALLTDIYFV
ncbi:putative ferric-chelate reductase 1 isoform X2 [Amia ocellicauda]|uniref:putative ferric-chelate reductase 1 isoform X2 n=1 Tax=Amia ocellicauda TaxID=2972642 RepID=UPI00346401AA